jgi:hypothetical protein
MGCFPAGSGFEVFANGLTLSMVNGLTLTPSSSYQTTNGNYLVKYTSMTLELCISICQANGLLYAGLETYSGTE